MNSIVRFIKKDIVLCISVLLAAITSIFAKPSFEMLVNAVDWRVIFLLFSLMLVIQAFRYINVLDIIASFFVGKCNSLRKLYFALILLVFFSSMIVTNDVALLTFVPITILIFKRINLSCVNIIILETIAANLGSSVTPMGNPQNLFLFSYYEFPSLDFILMSLKLGIISLILLVPTICFFTKSKGLIVVSSENNSREKFSVKLTLLYLFVLIMVLLSVFRIIDYRVSFVLSFVIIGIVNFRLLAKVDYALLITFIAFFIFTNNISNNQSISSFFSSILKNENSVFFSGVGLSQIISNVPASLLLSTFTDEAVSLFYGVNIGGLGTLIASLASVISYKIYKNEIVVQDESSNDKFILKFSVLNLIYLFILILVFFFIK